MSAKSAGPIRLVIFDCDGTLVDSQHNIVAAMGQAFGDRGHSPPAAPEVRAVVGLALVEAVAALRPGLPGDEHRAITERYKSVFLAMRQRPEHEEPLFPGVVDALDELAAAGCMLGIATGKARRGLDATLRMHGLDGRFVTLQTADLAPGKPHPAMVEQAMAEAGADAARTVVVGDTTFDIQMARNAGVAGIGVGWGYHPAESLRRAGAAAVIDRFDELTPLVAALMEGNACVSAGS